MQTLPQLFRIHDQVPRIHNLVFGMLPVNVCHQYVTKMNREWTTEWIIQFKYLAGSCQSKTWEQRLTQKWHNIPNFQAHPLNEN